ncbi:hypothetical protein TPHA_0G02690 [Tetrapisispora phaffii CBS 4417]|uniref:Nucleoporin POM152 n=1 Tax=Tetrapisispora phaffii (strain ATCC 24235 / CBS 4417 / NBRC 1672 / NRRL Y-8282 / UCD 70-5) TaxID=1071381 RepID=G8BW28_TETPH|nr:hypothetical protein TPHA_0G02690 [Tetrapisispora phaffii CBS 4417]CCE64106.1 hypothetical protein TPHA_0G02690 [Tetrapisispora phaffii CBS 4417]
MGMHSSNFEETPRGNHWIGTSTSSHSRYRDSMLSSRFQGNDDSILNPGSTRRKNFNSNNDIRQNSNDETNINNNNHNNSNDHDNNRNRNYNYISNVQPLISTEVIEVSKQRSLAILIFFLIQLYKVYDLVLLKSNIAVSGGFTSNFGFLLKYLIIDSCYFYFLPSFNIPTLTFKTWTITLQIMSIFMFNIFLTNDHEWIFLSTIIATWKKYNTKELSVTGDSINQRKLYDSSSHFKGALTIKILPENTAMLNPLQNSYCLPFDDSLFQISTVNVPIRINSTADIKFIQLEHRDIFTNEVELKNLTKKDWKTVKSLDDLTLMNKKMTAEKFRQEADKSIKYLNIPVKELGLYQIKKIVDSNDFNLKIYNSHLVVAQCPTARIQGAGLENRCIGDSDKVSIEIDAVAPLQLSYVKIIDGVEYSYFDKNLQPESFKSPLQKSKKDVLSKADMENLFWARNQEVVIDFDTVINQAGKHIYKVSSIIDGLGNVMDLKQFSPDVLEEFEYNYDFNVHSIPRATLDEKVDPKSPTKRTIVINFINEEPKSLNGISSKPYMAKIEVTSPEGTKSYFNITSRFSKYEFEAEVPGTYTLQSVYSNFCPGVVAGKTSLIVSQPIAPKLTVDAKPILDQCLGQIGLDFELTFTGLPPFNFEAKIYKLHEGTKKLFETKKYVSPSTRYQISYNPKVEGNYEIVFDNLSNEVFTDAINLTPIKDYSFETTMRVKPGAVFQNRSEKQLCLNDGVDIPVMFKGEPPFTLNYDLIEIFSNKRKSFNIEDIDSFNYKIKTPEFKMGGEYILSLISVKDLSGCVAPLTDADIRIKVRRDIPTASMNFLDNMKTLNINEGSIATIPIKLSGESPFTIKYAQVDKNSGILESFEEKFHSNYNSVIKVRKQGYYKLLEVRDVSCKGKIIDSDKLFRINFFKKPSYEVLEKLSIKTITKKSFVKDPVCEGASSSVDLALSGSPPFTLLYEIISPSGVSSEKKTQIATKYASIKVPSDQNGEYTIKIKDIFDSNYGESNMNIYNQKSGETIIKQYVNAIPKVNFANAGKTFRTCITNIGQKDMLAPINLRVSEGADTFIITFNVYHESTGRAEKIIIDNVTADDFRFEMLYKDLGLGSHDITIEKIEDVNGCVNILSESESNHVFIKITDAPKIQLLDPSATYCVGDYISYQLSGSSPFLIRYDFNGIQLKTKEQTSQFVRLASEAGSISINSISDSTSQCLVDFMLPSKKKEAERLSLVIHPLPSVTVSQGEYLIEDIHEGDQAEVIFSFEGTPPFSLTFVRTEENLNTNVRGKPQIVETHKVTDIYEFEYRVKTSLQGTYEAIEVSDAYCMAKNDAFFLS